MRKKNAKADKAQEKLLNSVDKQEVELSEDALESAAGGMVVYDTVNKIVATANDDTGEVLSVLQYGNSADADVMVKAAQNIANAQGVSTDTYSYDLSDML